MIPAWPVAGRRGLAPISFIGDDGGSSTATAAVHAGALAGDFGIFCAGDDIAAVAAPGLTGIGAVDGTAVSAAFGRKFLTGSADTMVFSVSVLRLRSAVYRGATELLSVTVDTGTGTSYAIPAKAIADPRSWVVFAIALGGTSGSPFATPPSLLTNRGIVTAAALSLSTWDSNGPVASFAGDTIGWATGSREYAALTAVLR